MGMAELSQAITALVEQEPAAVTDEALAKLLVELEEAQTRFDAAQMAFLVEAKRRKLGQRNNVRNDANWLADATRQGRRSMGSRLKTADDLIHRLPKSSRRCNSP